jgi:putative restriction endonuclease
MAKAIFMSKVDTTYDDRPWEYYHFPATYINQARQAVGDWIIYYETKRNGGRKNYYATAKVGAIDPDPKRPDHFYARISDYIEFPNSVPLRIDGQMLESGLEKADGSINKGQFGRAIHLLPELEYHTIVQYGMRPTIDAQPPAEDAYLAAEPEAEYGRRIAQSIVNRPVRDAAFQELVRQAYDATCAFTGLRIINGGGKCEIEAAHIRPVHEHGPDSARNGVALSRTVHWMFDRGILSMEDDGKMLVAKKLVSEPARRLLNPDGYAKLPEHLGRRPHPVFLRFHREKVFKG